MQDLIKNLKYDGKNVAGGAALSALYDKYSPALYGKILSIVKQKEIAEKILIRVFINSLPDKIAERPEYTTLFTTLLNQTRKKTYGTLKALRMFEACSCGIRTVSPAQ